MSTDIFTSHGTKTPRFNATAIYEESDSGWFRGVIYDDTGQEKGRHTSSTMQWLCSDLREKLDMPNHQDIQFTKGVIPPQQDKPKTEAYELKLPEPEPKPRIKFNKWGQVMEHFLEFDAEGRVIVKDGRTLEEYLNDPHIVAKRKEMTELHGMPLIMISVDVYEQNNIHPSA